MRCARPLPAILATMFTAVPVSSICASSGARGTVATFSGMMGCPVVGTPTTKTSSTAWENCKVRLAFSLVIWVTKSCCFGTFSCQICKSAASSIASLPKIKDYRIITDYCLGAYGKVKTVLLLSNTPIEKVKKISLDYRSMSSVNLVRILAKKWWNMEFDWSDTSEVPDTYSESSVKRYFNVQRELNAVQWHITTNGLTARYVLRTLQTHGTDTQSGKPRSWRI